MACLLCDADIQASKRRGDAIILDTVAYYPTSICPLHPGQEYLTEEGCPGCADVQRMGKRTSAVRQFEELYPLPGKPPVTPVDFANVRRGDAITLGLFITACIVLALGVLLALANRWWVV